MNRSQHAEPRRPRAGYSARPPRPAIPSESPLPGRGPAAPRLPGVLTPIYRFTGVYVRGQWAARFPSCEALWVGVRHVGRPDPVGGPDQDACEGGLVLRGGSLGCWEGAGALSLAAKAEAGPGP